MPSDFALGVITGATVLVIGFCIGWNAAFFVMWKKNKERADELKRKIFQQ